MKYIIEGAKNTNRFYDKKSLIWLYAIGFTAVIAWEYFFNQAEFYSTVIFYLVIFSVPVTIIEFFLKPKSFLYLNFENDRLEIGFYYKKHNQTIAHNNLKSIDTTMTDVVIKTKDGRTLEVPLSHFFYNEVIAIKEEVFNLQEKLTNSLELLATE